jgi:hypothetical protein
VCVCICVCVESIEVVIGRLVVEVAIVGESGGSSREEEEQLFRRILSQHLARRLEH